MSNRLRKDTARRGSKSNPANTSAHTQLIESYKRRLEHGAKITPLPLERPSSLGPLKLTGNAESFLGCHVIREFVSRAQPSCEEKRYFELAGYARETLVVEHAKTYGRAIQWAVGEFADLLVQAVLGKTRRRDISEKVRSAVWEEALGFADVLASEGLWHSWLKNCYFPRVRDPKSIEWGDPEREKFWKRLSFHRGEWLSEADRRINLRLLLAGAKEGVKRVEPRRREIAKLMVEHPQSPDRELCLLIDRRNEGAHSRQNEVPLPVPDFLKRARLRLWAEAFEGDRKQETQRMHEYFSKIRKDFRLQDLP